MFDRLSHAVGATQTLVASGRDLCARSESAVCRSRQAIQRTILLLNGLRSHPQRRDHLIAARRDRPRDAR